MKHLVQIALLSFCTSLSAQSVQWLHGSPLSDDLNPGAVSNVLCTTDAEHVYAGRTTERTYSYNLAFGHTVVERYGATGETIWSLAIGDSVALECMASDASGNVIVGGQFFGTAHITATDSITDLFGPFYPETFLLALDADGDVLWHRNVSPGEFDEADVQAITFDPQGRAWYALSTFFHASLIRLDAEGNDSETRVIDNSKTIGSLSFDFWGGLYVSGSTTNPGITVNGTSFPVDETYAFFVTRMDATGQAQWMHAAHDVTFQRPRVVADATGHAYLAGTPFDTLSWGDLHFHGPQWNGTIFLTRLDSSGHFDWGLQSPQTEQLTGRFSFSGSALGVDANSNVYLIGDAQGVLDWGNDVVTNIGEITDAATTLLCFNALGIPQWQLHADQQDAEVPQTLTVDGAGTCHFATASFDTFSMGGDTVGVGAYYGVVVGRIDHDAPSSVDEQEAARSIAAFPSPFDRSFQLEAARLDAQHAISISVMDAAGQVVERSADVKRSLGDALAAGMYTVDVEQGGTHWRARVVKR